MPEISVGQSVVAFLLVYVILSLFCLTLYKASMQVRESNRTMPSGQIWLLLIPLWSLFWNFRVVFSMTSSLYKEFTDRDFEIEEKPGFTFGIIYAVLKVVPSIVVIAMPSLFIIATILDALSYLFLAMYWMKINWYRKVLENDESADSEDDLYEAE
jgi:hypothetical protein